MVVTDKRSFKNYFIFTVFKTESRCGISVPKIIFRRQMVDNILEFFFVSACMTAVIGVGEHCVVCIYPIVKCCKEIEAVVSYLNHICFKHFSCGDFYHTSFTFHISVTQPHNGISVCGHFYNRRCAVEVSETVCNRFVSRNCVLLSVENFKFRITEEEFFTCLEFKLFYIGAELTESFF